MVVVPLKREFRLLVESLEALGYSSKKAPRTATFKDLNTICVHGGSGKVDFALYTYHYLKKYPIKEVIGMGTCGALNEKLNPMDVVIGVKIIEHDYKSCIDQKQPQFTPPLFWLTEIKSHLIECFFGVIASGDEDIVDTQRACELRKNTYADAVAWEGAGGARACQLTQVPYIEVRGVCDTSRSTTLKELTRYLPQTMSHLAQVLIQIPYAKTTSKSSYSELRI